LHHLGRLERRVKFILNEFENFTPLADFTNKLTVGGGRAMRFRVGCASRFNYTMIPLSGADEESSKYKKRLYDFIFIETL
jgi:hypothetical protein